MKNRFLVQLRFLVGFEEADAVFWKYSITWKAAISLETKQPEASDLPADLAEVAELCHPGRELPWVFPM